MLLALGAALWACGSEPESPEIDPLAELVRADRLRFDDLLRQSQLRTQAGREAAVEAAAFAREVGDSSWRAEAQARVDEALRWRELGSECALVDAWNTLDAAEDGVAAYRRFAFGCGPEVAPTFEAHEIDRAAAHCVIRRVRLLDAGEGNVRAVLHTAGGGEGGCAFDSSEEGTFTLRFPSLGRVSDVPARLGPAQALSALVLDGRSARFSLQGERTRAHAHAFGDDRIVVDIEVPRERGSVDEAPVILLDPGHGGEDMGAQFEELTEASLVLDLARRVRVELAERIPSARVFMTREEDVAVPLEERAVRANSLGADLFLSIHLNSANEEVHRGGVTTFVLDTTDDVQARRLAARENGARVHEVTGLQQLLAGLHRRTQLDASRRLARAVHRRTLAAGRRVMPRLPDRGVKSAMFYVLVGAQVPAVLLEASFLTKADEAAALRTENYRRHLAAGIAAGIVDYLSTEEPAVTER